MDDSKWDDPTAATLAAITQALLNAQVIALSNLPSSTSLTRSHLHAPQKEDPDLSSKVCRLSF